MSKPYLSHSQIDLYTRCGEAYRRRYVEREVLPGGVAAMKGSGVHRGLETNMRQKIDSYVDLPRKEIIDAAVEAFDAQSRGGYMLTPEESSVGPRKILGEARDDVAEMAGVSADHQSPEYQPVATERLVRIELPNCSRDLVGVLDLVDNKGRVTDFKTSGKAKSQLEADTSVQLGIYDACYRSVTGQAPTELRLDTIVRTKTKTVREVRVTHRTEQDLATVAARFNMVLAGITAGVFLPATPGDWICSAKWCAFHSTCPYVSHGRKSE